MIVTFEPMAAQIFLTQDCFEALSSTNLKAQITENRGKLEIIFNVQQKKDGDITTVKLGAYTSVVFKIIQ